MTKPGSGGMCGSVGSARGAALCLVRLGSAMLVTLRIWLHCGLSPAVGAGWGCGAVPAGLPLSCAQQVLLHLQVQRRRCGDDPASELPRRRAAVLPAAAPGSRQKLLAEAHGAW